MEIIKREIATILGIDSSSSWSIFDSLPEENLYLVHYNEDANLSKYGELRGVIIDTKLKIVVCRSFGYTPVATRNTLSPEETTGVLKIKDDQGSDHIFAKDEYTIRPGFEGVILRAFKHDGKVYLSSHKRIVAKKSRWGNSEPFLELYHKLGGPAEDQLFDTNCKYSPYCHIFLVTSPKLLVATKQDVGLGYVVYLGMKKVWNPQFLQDVTQVEQKAKNPVCATLKTLNKVSEGTSTKTSSLVLPREFNLSQANSHLDSGYYTPVQPAMRDNRLKTGEFVILYRKPRNEKSSEIDTLGSLLKVQSEAYAWRTGMRDNTPNLKYRFYQLTNGSHLETTSLELASSFIQNFPLLPLYKVETVLKEIVGKSGSLIVLPDEGAVLPRTQDERLHIIWLDFLISVPPQQQKEVAPLYLLFNQEREQVIDWLFSLNEKNILSTTSNTGNNSNTGNDNSSVNYPPRLYAILATSRKLVNGRKERKEREEGKEGKERKERKERKLRDAIRSLIYRERGSSLYTLVKTMKDEMKSKLEVSPPSTKV